MLSLKIKVEEKKKETNTNAKDSTPPKIIVFTSIFEHHSNLLPWREYSDLVVEIPEDYINGGIDMEYLKNKLEEYKNWYYLICFLIYL